MFDWLTKMFASQSSKEAESLARMRLQAENYRLSSRYKTIKAKYDAAQTTEDNRRHWMFADALSARASNRLQVREILRRRSRYEVANNCHARGITLTLANDMIGTGPRLQCLSPDESVNDAVENAWNEWADAIFLQEKLHTFALSTIVDGESFFLLTTNSSLVSSVQLDVKLVDCDQITTPSGASLLPGMVDGIEFDANKNPVMYHMLRVHPGDLGVQTEAIMAYDRIPARNMIHWYRVDRPDQARGIPEITPALPIFSQLRRYTLAVLMSAEIAADFAIFISTDQPPAEGVPTPQAFDSTEIDKGMITAMPEGYKPFQLVPAQPTATHDSFTKTLLREACHCLNIPYNIATADFSQDSYAGGRMAQGVYQRYVEVRRKHFMARVMDRLFSAWLAEATLVDSRLPADLPAFAGSIPHTWFFDEWVHVDPLKEANATKIELETGMTTHADEYAKKGKDWRKQLVQLGREFELLRENKALVLPPGTPPLDGTSGAPPAQQDAANGATA